MKALVVIVVVVLLLAGCASSVVRTPLVCMDAPAPDKVELLPVTWVPVMSGGVWFMGLDGGNIDNLQLNLLSLKRHMEQRRLEVGYYKDCITRSQEPSVSE